MITREPRFCLAPMKSHFIAPILYRNRRMHVPCNFQRLSKTIYYKKAVGVVGKSFNQLLIETADSANPAHSDEMNVVQIRYGLVGPNTACTPKFVT